MPYGEDATDKRVLFDWRERYYPHCTIIPREDTNSKAEIINPFNLFEISSSTSKNDLTGNGGLYAKLRQINKDELSKLKSRELRPKGIPQTGGTNYDKVKLMINTKIVNKEVRTAELLRLEKLKALLEKTPPPSTKQQLNDIGPIDVNRCQYERKGGSFMTLGPRPTERCIVKPKYILIERDPSDKDGLTGGMSLCEEHLEEFKKKFSSDYAVIFRITRSKRKSGK